MKKIKNTKYRKFSNEISIIVLSITAAIIFAAICMFLFKESLSQIITGSIAMFIGIYISYYIMLNMSFIFSSC